jgi:hypothetical protein
MRSRFAILLGMAGLSLGACATDSAYGGPLVGYGYGTPYSCGYSNAYASPSCGWYGNYFYPGSGLYSYDRGHNRHVWNGGGRPAADGRACAAVDSRKLGRSADCDAARLWKSRLWRRSPRLSLRRGGSSGPPRAAAVSSQST